MMRYILSMIIGSYPVDAILQQRLDDALGALEVQDKLHSTRVKELEQSVVKLQEENFLLQGKVSTNLGDSFPTKDEILLLLSDFCEQAMMNYYYTNSPLFSDFGVSMKYLVMCVRRMVETQSNAFKEHIDNIYQFRRIGAKFEQSKLSLHTEEHLRDYYTTIMAIDECAINSLIKTCPMSGSADRTTSPFVEETTEIIKGIHSLCWKIRLAKMVFATPAHSGPYRHLTNNQTLTEIFPPVLQNGEVVHHGYCW